MSPAMPASPLALTVRKALEDRSIYLATDIEYVPSQSRQQNTDLSRFNFIMRIFLDLDKIISLIPRQLDAAEEGMTYVERL